MAGFIRLSLRLLLTSLWLVIIIFPLYVTWQLRLSRANSAVMMFSFYVGCLLWGLKVTTKGKLSPKRPLLVISNHFSYLDVFALGSRIPVRFTPKSEVASWPVIGLICRIGGCIFINRRTSRILHDRSELDYAINHGDLVSLFPEGTTGDGSALLPFKSSFFSIVEHKPLAVQPVSVVYTRMNGLPLTDANRLQVGWYGDAEFFPHVVHVLAQKNVEVTLVFHPAVNGDEFESRKVLASYCRDVIGKTVMEG